MANCVLLPNRLHCRLSPNLRSTVAKHHYTCLHLLWRSPQRTSRCHPHLSQGHELKKSGYRQPAKSQSSGLFKAISPGLALFIILPTAPFLAQCHNNFVFFCWEGEKEGVLEFNVFRKRPDPVFSVAMNKLRERPRRVKLPSPFVARLASCTYEIALHAVLLSEAVQSAFRKGESTFCFSDLGSTGL